MSLTDWIPTPLHALGPWDLAWWQWMAIALLLVLAYLFGAIARWLFSWALKRVVKHTVTTFDDDLVDRLAGPLRLLGTIALFRVGMPVLELPPDRAETIQNILLGGLAFGIVWGLLRAIDVIIGHASRASWVSTRPTSRSLLSLVGRIMKVVVVVIAIISALGTMGLPVGSVLAGLGIGGIALAFGAQKTVENLFGAVALGVDQPLREGDLVTVDGNVQGTVESIGLRSTRLRTADRTVVTLPNGRLSDMRIETFAARDRIRFATTIALVYGTTAAQMRQVLEGIERTLREHPKQFDRNEITVRFIALGQSSLDLEVSCMFATSDSAEFRAIRQELLLAIMDVVEKAGTSFAFPTRTVHVASVPAKAA